MTWLTGGLDSRSATAPAGARRVNGFLRGSCESGALLARPPGGAVLRAGGRRSGYRSDRPALAGRGCRPTPWQRLIGLLSAACAAAQRLPFRLAERSPHLAVDSAHHRVLTKEDRLQYDYAPRSSSRQRSTFSYLEARLAASPRRATKEGSIGIPPKENFHYRPLWAPGASSTARTGVPVRLSDPTSSRRPRITTTRRTDEPCRDARRVRQVAGLPRDALAC